MNGVQSFRPNFNLWSGTTKPALLAAAMSFMTTSALAEDQDLSNHYITAICLQDEIQIEYSDEAVTAWVNDLFYENNPEMYRLEIAQISPYPIASEFHGDLFLGFEVYDHEDSHQFHIAAYDTRVSETEPEFSVKAAIQPVVSFRELIFQGSSPEGTIDDGFLKILYGEQLSYISINGESRRFTCEVQMIERE